MLYLIGSKLSHVLAIELYMYSPPLHDIVDPWLWKSDIRFSVIRVTVLCAEERKMF